MQFRVALRCPAGFARRGRLAFRIHRHAENFPLVQRFPLWSARPFGLFGAALLGDHPPVSGTFLALACKHALHCTRASKAERHVVVTAEPERSSVDAGSEAARAADLTIADQCRLNVLWLHGVWPCDRALSIDVPHYTLGDALESFSRQVERMPVNWLSTRGLSEQSNFPKEHFDLVTLYGHAPELAALVELRRLLRPGGLALIAADNRWWLGRLRFRRSKGARLNGLGELARTVRRAGFREGCSYWVEPSLAAPRTLIPDEGDRVGDAEAMRAREWGRDRLRSAVLAMGLPGLLFPAVLIVAKA